MKRVGRCRICREGGERKDEYEILRTTEGSLFIRYVGFLQGEFFTGLPSRGPNAYHMQVLLPFEGHRGLLTDITFFEEAK
jgi:hypothetical protein